MEKTFLGIAIILITTKLFGFISQKLKMPSVLGYLMAGVVLGPMLLNIIKYENNIKVLANLGVVLLMFLAGLETNIEEFKKSGKSALIIAILGIFVPLLFGTSGAFLFSGRIIENLFVGIVLTATSVSITAETLTELGKLNSKAGINILGAAVIDDILGLFLISMLLSVAVSPGNTNIASITVVFLKIVIFCVLSVFAILYLPKMMDYIAKKVTPGRTLLTLSIAFTLLAAFVSESFGIASITGAYICGLLFSKFIHKEYLERNIKAISSGFLSPIFFASIGIEVTLDGFGIRTFIITLIMFGIAVLGKIIGCGSGALLSKMSKSESLQVGIGMVSRGEVAIITANIGLQHNLISQDIFVTTVIVVLLTTIITPILLKKVFSHKYETKINQHGYRK